MKRPLASDEKSQSVLVLYNLVSSQKGMMKRVSFKREGGIFSKRLSGVSIARHMIALDIHIFSLLSQGIGDSREQGIGGHSRSVQDLP